MGGVAKNVPSMKIIGLSNKTSSCFGLPNNNIRFLRPTKMSENKKFSPLDVI
jgi:hypothetical protein